MSKIKPHNAGAAFYGSTLVVLSSVFYGSYGVWARLMGDNFGPFMQAWIRAALVCLTVLPFTLWGKRRWERIRWREDKWWLLVWCVGNSCIGSGLYYAFNHIDIGLVLLTFYGGYVVTMFGLGRILNGERYGAAKITATLLAFAGLVLTSSPSFGQATFLPFMAAFVSGVCTGIDMVVAQRVKYHSAQTTVLAWVTGMVGTVPLSFLLHEHVPGPHAYASWGYLLAYATVCVAASWLAIHGVKQIEAGTAGILGLLEIVWGILFGVVFFHERPAVLAYVGAVCIITAAAIPYLKELKKPKRQEIVEEIPA